MYEAPQQPRPLEPGQGKSIAAFLVSFVVWLPVYLMLVRPVINGFLAQYITSYPAMLHLVPIFGLPITLFLLLEVLRKKRQSR